MGLTTWKNARAGPIRKADIGIAKNYLTHEELAALNRVVTMYLDYAEDQAVERIKRLEQPPTAKPRPAKRAKKEPPFGGP